MPDLSEPLNNGTPPSQAGKKLTQANYADRALASLDQGRHVNDQLLRRTLGDFDPDNITHQDRRRMRQDTMVKMGLWYTKAPLTRADRAFECEDPAIAAGVQEIVMKTFISDMKIALNMLDFGFQGAIKDYRYGRLEATYEDPRTGKTRPVWDDEDVDPIVFGSMVPLPPETTRVHLEQGRFAGIVTPLSNLRGERDASKPVPPEWCLWFVNEFEEEFRNWYGRARIDPAYRAWYSYWFIHHMRDRHAEMDADPPLQVWYPPGSQTVDGVQRSNRDAALEIGAKLRGGATIAWPSDVHVAEDGRITTQKLWEAAFLQGGENLAAFSDILADLEIQKLRGVLVPEQALVEARRGTSSRNASATFVDIFTQSLEQSAQYLDQLWNDYRIPAIVEANWGKDAPSCKMKTTGFQEEDLSLATELIKIAFNLDPNALPIKFEDLVKQLGLPTYSKEEQEERQQAVAEAQAAKDQEAAAAAAEQGAVPPGQEGGGAPTPDQLQASQRRTKPRKYEREVIHLSGEKLESTAPEWARKEANRRQRNLSAIAERLSESAEAMYADLFHTAAVAIEDLGFQLSDESDTDLQLGMKNWVSDLVSRIRTAVRSRLDSRWQDTLQAEHASMYHATGLAELQRLGLAAESWDVGRDEVQDWAREHAGELVKTIDRTVVDQYIQPWLTRVLPNAGYDGSPTGIPFSTMELAAQLRDAFDSYPQWMAERLVRTESMRGYNLSAADMWERLGVTEVEMYDGLGGKSGITDAECLARNGQVVTLDEFRQATHDEHPNGSLGAVPVTVDVTLQELEPGLVSLNASVSPSIYAVDAEGFILSQEETGLLLAGE